MIHPHYSFRISELKDEPLERKIANNKGKMKVLSILAHAEKRQKQQRQFVNEILVNLIKNGNHRFAVDLLFF